MELLRKAIDTAATIGRVADTYTTRPLRLVCPVCNNLSPHGHFESSDKSLGFFDNSTIEQRQAVHSGAVWLFLDVEVKKVLRAAKGYARSVPPCLYCILLLKALQHYFPEWFSTDVSNEDEEVSSSQFDCTLTSDGETEISLLLVQGQPIIVRTYAWSSQLGSYVFSFEIQETQGHAENPHRLMPNCGSFTDRSTRSDDTEAWGFIRGRVQECNDQHVSCQASKAPGPLPKRLLDVGSDSDSPRLHETSTGQKDVYIALSHCWGQDNPLRTLTSNLEQMKSGIDIEDLNDIFKDAITATRNLGLRYIWIDSLCIIQDMWEDWDEQASQMAHIYEPAYATIVSGSSPGPSTPFLNERDSCWQSWSLKLNSGENTHQFRIRRKVLPVIEIATRASYASADWIERAAQSSSRSALNYMWDGHLYTRAWCFQEQLLANRLIHFAPGAIIWECQVHRVVEAEDPVPKELDDTTADPQANTSRESTEVDHTKEWHNDVTNYSRRNLTFATDRLVALSGVATSRAQKTGDRYLAGLWESSLFWDLLWHTRPGIDMPVPERSIAPSWSWASVGGPVLWNSHAPSNIMATYASVIRAETTPKSTLSPFGDVDDTAFVVLRGLAVEARITMDENMAECGDARIVGSWEKEGSGHFFLPDVRLYEADGLLEGGETVKTFRRAKSEEEYDRYADTEEGYLCYDMGVTILCFLRTKALDVVGLVLGRSTTVPGAYVRLAPVWKLPASYAKRGVEKTITIV